MKSRLSSIRRFRDVLVCAVLLLNPFQFTTGVLSINFTTYQITLPFRYIRVAGFRGRPDPSKIFITKSRTAWEEAKLVEKFVLAPVERYEECEEVAQIWIKFERWIRLRCFCIWCHIQNIYQIKTFPETLTTYPDACFSVNFWDPNSLGPQKLRANDGRCSYTAPYTFWDCKDLDELRLGFLLPKCDGTLPGFSVAQIRQL